MVKPVKLPYHCWQCGVVLEALLVPVPRYEACPQCRAELHSCRMCRHYDPKVIGECRHDRADRVERKHEANYCTYFRARSGEHRSDRPMPADASRAELNALFGLDGGGDDEPAATPESLFGLTPPKSEEN